MEKYWFGENCLCITNGPKNWEDPLAKKWRNYYLCLKIDPVTNFAICIDASKIKQRIRVGNHPLLLKKDLAKTIDWYCQWGVVNHVTSGNYPEVIDGYEKTVINKCDVVMDGTKHWTR